MLSILEQTLKSVSVVFPQQGRETEPVFLFLLQDFDPNSAFFTKVVNKKKKGDSSAASGNNNNNCLRGDKRSDLQNGGKHAADDLDPLVLRSRSLASEYFSLCYMACHWSICSSLCFTRIIIGHCDYQWKFLEVCYIKV